MITPRRALISRALDFWLLRGASILVFPWEKYRGQACHECWGSAIALGLVLAGWLCFAVTAGDTDSLTFPFQSESFFLLTALIFITVHHYFLDHVLWRVRDDPEVRAALVGL